MDSKLAIAGAVGGIVGGLVGAVAVTLATRGKSSTRSSSSSILIFYPQSEFEDCRHLGNRLIHVLVHPHFHNREEIEYPPFAHGRPAKQRHPGSQGHCLPLGAGGAG